MVQAPRVPDEGSGGESVQTGEERRGDEGENESAKAEPIPVLTDIFDPEITRLLETLADPERQSDWEGLGAENNRLSDIVNAGPALAAMAAEMLASPRREEQVRAEIIFAQLREYPEAVVRRYIDSDDDRLWAWAYLTAKAFGRHREFMMEPPSLPANIRYGPQGGFNPVRDLAEEIKPKLRNPDYEPGGLWANDDDEYAVDYRETFRPALEHFWDYVEDENYLWVDLDGDYIEEVVAWGKIPNFGWRGGDFFVLLKRKSLARPFRVEYVMDPKEYESSSDVSIEDLNADGLPDIVLQGGYGRIQVAGTIISKGRSDLRYNSFRGYRGGSIIYNKNTSQGYILQYDYERILHTSTAVELVGSLGIHCQLTGIGPRKDIAKILIK